MKFPTIENAQLILVDLQQKLIPAMADPDAVVSRAALLLKGAGELGMEIIVSEQYPKGLGTTVPEIATWLPDSAKRLEKSAFSLFEEPAFPPLLAQKPKEVLIFAGVETHVCVLQSVWDAIARGYEVIVVEDAVGSRKAGDRESGLAACRQAGAAILSAEALLFMLLRTSRHPAFKAVSQLVK